MESEHEKLKLLSVQAINYQPIIYQVQVLLFIAAACC